MAALNLHRWGGCRRIYVPPLPFCGVSPSERQITGMGKAAETHRNKRTAEAEVPLQVIYFKPTSIRHLWCFRHRNFISEALYRAAYVEHIAAIDSRAINRTAHFHRSYCLASQVAAALCPCRKDCFLSFFLSSLLSARRHSKKCWWKQFVRESKINSAAPVRVQHLTGLTKGRKRCWRGRSCFLFFFSLICCTFL